MLRQVSPESELIYDFILKLHSAVSGKWSQYVESKSISQQDLDWLLEYASQVMSNLGNYKSFGDTKFVPRVDQQAVEKLVGSVKSSDIQDLWSKIKEPMYSTAPEKKNLLGFPDEGHTTTYYSKDVTKAEIQAVQNVLAHDGLLVENSRLFKTGDNQFELRVASAEKTPSRSFNLDGEGSVTLTFGDHSAEMQRIVECLEQAAKYAANATQTKMLEAYIDAFRTGSMDAHKESQKFWVKDLSPKVETNIGFIETYRDPAGVRGEWEGLVAMVNKERTKQFGELVRQAQQLIEKLPWPKEFEKDEFSAPDFTSLEVLTFAGSGIPAGINIPNYDDVRLSVGFKNVSLGNVLSAKGSNEKVTFLGEADAELYEKYHAAAFEMQVGIHELLGHGTGKLLSQERDGTFNFKHPVVSPITGEQITTFYKPGETWGSKFGAMAASYEECRAETVAMYLACEPSALKIFGHEGAEAEAVLYAAYLQMARAGLLALEFWDPESRKWGQAHMQARYSILQAFLRAESSQPFVKLSYTQPDYSDLTLELDRTQIQTVGKAAMAHYLQQIHVYKCAGDYEAAKALYDDMTFVNAEMQSMRQAVLAKKLPRKQFVQSNTAIAGGSNGAGGGVELLEYEATAVGMITSFADRQV